MHQNVTVYERTSQFTPEISILCTTYNNEAYIEQALDSFLEQETSIKFEIVIHDDASNDRTQDILKSYYNRSPDKIRLIFQNENQYSKGNFLPLIYASTYTEANTLMLCEGDDYWTSPLKLNEQYTAYRNHPNIDLVFHSSYQLFKNGRQNLWCQHSDDSYIFSANRVILGTGGFCPSPSILINKEVLTSLPKDLLKEMPCGDVFIQIWGSIKGGALFLPHPYCIYRDHSTSSVTDALEKSSTEKQYQFHNAIANSYRLLRNYLPLKHYMPLLKMEKRYRKKAGKIKKRTK